METKKEERNIDLSKNGDQGKEVSKRKKKEVPQKQIEKKTKGEVREKDEEETAYEV